MASPTRFRPLQQQYNLSGIGPVIQGNASTTSGSAIAVSSFSVPAGCVAYFTATIVGRRQDGVNAGDGAVATITCAYKNVAGTVTQIGSDTVALPYASASINASAASSSVSGVVVSLNIAGVASATINWSVQSGFVILSF